MSLTVIPSGAACGATVTGVDLSKALAADEVAAIRAAWLQHHVLAFPDQAMSDDDLERFTVAFGGFGDDFQLTCRVEEVRCKAHLRSGDGFD